MPYSDAVHLNLNPAVLSSALSLMADAVRVMVAPSLTVAVAPWMVAVGALGLDSVVNVAWAAPFIRGRSSPCPAAGRRRGIGEGARRCGQVNRESGRVGERS